MCVRTCIVQERLIHASKDRRDRAPKNTMCVIAQQQVVLLAKVFLDVVLVVIEGDALIVMVGEYRW